MKRSTLVIGCVAGLLLWAAISIGCHAAVAAPARPTTEQTRRLAACESGEWDRSGHPILGTERWDYRDRHHQSGAFSILDSTWRTVNGRYPTASVAPPLVQIEAMWRIVQRDGWRAFPTCSRKIGAR